MKLLSIFFNSNVGHKNAEKINTSEDKSKCYFCPVYLVTNTECFMAASYIKIYEAPNSEALMKAVMKRIEALEDIREQFILMKPELLGHDE